MGKFAANARRDLSRGVRHRYWRRWRRCCGCRRRSGDRHRWWSRRRSRRYGSGSGRGDAGHRHWHVDVLRWRNGRIPDCSRRRDQRRLWIVPRNVTRKYNLARLRVQQFVAIVPVVVAEVQKLTQAGTGITRMLSGHSVVGRLEKWQQRQHRAVPIKYIMGGKPSVICCGSRPIEALRGPQQ